MRGTTLYLLALISQQSSLTKLSTFSYLYNLLNHIQPHARYAGNTHRCGHQICRRQR